MKKIALVSPHKEYNYGTVLQAYALQTMVESLGYRAHYLTYSPSKHSALKRFVKAFLRYLNVFNVQNKQSINKDIEDFSFFRLPVFKPFVSGFEEFIANYIKVTKITYNPDSLATCCEYDAFMVGSDQTWGERRMNKFSPYFLDYTNDRYPRLSYAPSIGTTHIPDQFLQILKTKLSRFDALSCRERTNCITLTHELGKDVRFVIDPTLLMTPSQWNDLIGDFECEEYGLKKKQFVLCYILGEKKIISEFAERLGREKGLTVCYVVTRPVYLNKSHPIFVNPKTFLALVRDAAYVITDSFHGTAFSINYSTQFFCFTKREESLNTDNDRILEFLSEFSLENRLMDEKNQIPEDVDFNSVRMRLEKLRTESHAYLTDMLNLI